MKMALLSNRIALTGFMAFGPGSEPFGRVRFFKIDSLALTSWYYHPLPIAMSAMKRKKKGADDPPRTIIGQTIEAREPIHIADADNKSNQKRIEGQEIIKPLREI